MCVNATLQHLPCCAALLHQRSSADTMQGFVGPETYSFDHRAIVRADGGVLIRTLMAERKAWSQQQKIRIATERWLRELDPSSSYVLQVGANEHTKPKGVDFVDPVPLAIDLGWRAGLVEPVPYLVSKLRPYQNAIQNRVQIVQGAVCRSCQQQDAKIWSVELDSNPATLGSNHSDPRCAQCEALSLLHRLHRSLANRSSPLTGTSPGGAIGAISALSSSGGLCPQTAFEGSFEIILWRTEYRVCASNLWYPVYSPRPQGTPSVF